MPDRWIGAIYAPNVDFSFGGHDEYCGSLAVNSVRMHGNVKFHFDEALSAPTGGTSIRVTSWLELWRAYAGVAEL